MDFENFSDIGDARSDVFEARVEEAEKLKTRGNEFFHKGDLFNAEYFYHKALYHINFDEMQWNFELMDEHRDTVTKVKTPACLNLAAVRIQDQCYESAVNLCKEVLKEDPDNPKAHYRLAVAYFSMKNTDSALDAVDAALRRAPTDPKVRNLKLQIRQELQREKEKVRKFWRGRLKKKTTKVSVRWLLSRMNPFNIYYWFLPFA